MNTVNDLVLDKIEAKRQEVINRLLGPEQRFPITPDVTTKFIDPTWSGKPAPARPPKNALDIESMQFLAKYNRELRRNGGRIIRRMEGQPLAEVPPPVK